LKRPAVVIACGRQKVVRPARALDLYRGPLFRAAREWALSVTIPERIWILSARWGLVPARGWLEPYDHQAGDADELAVVIDTYDVGALAELAREPGVFLVGGAVYAEGLRRHLGNVITLAECLPPGRETRGIGAQRSWLIRHPGRLPLPAGGRR
jgi:hypothetical protein